MPEEMRRRLRSTNLIVLCAAVIAGTVVAAAPRTTWDGVFTSEQAQHGSAVYQEQCAGCHGLDLEGGEDAPTLAGPQFSLIWNGKTLGELIRRMRSKMPLEAPGSLSQEAYTDLTAYILRRNGFPVGSRPLSTDLTVLESIQYLSAAP